MIEPIKREYNVSDAQIGLLTGILFAACYLAASIPLARMADVGSRRALMAACLAFWSAMTALGGVAQSFTQLLFTRVGVAIGEAGAGPTSHSMISDLYSQKSRATMISLFVGMQALGVALGVFIGGVLSQNFGWRAALIGVGVPGVLLAVLILLTVREPPRGMSDARAADEEVALGATMAHLWSLRSYRFIACTAALGAVPGYGVLTWAPSFFMRVHNLTPAAVGLWFGLVAGGALFIGSVVSGVIADRVGRQDVRRYMWLAALSSLLAAPLGLIFLNVQQTSIAFGCMFAMQVMLAMHNPICLAMTQMLAPPRMRAVASVVVTMMTTAVGIGLAPLLVGIGNDLFEPTYGREAIKYSLSFVLLGSMAAATLAWVSTIWLRSDLERV